MCKSHLAIRLFPVLNQMLLHKLKIFKKRSTMIKDFICKCACTQCQKTILWTLKKELASLCVPQSRCMTNFCAFVQWHESFQYEE